MPPTNLSKSYGELKSFSNPQPSIGIAYMAAVLREKGYETEIIDAYVSGYTLTKILELIKKSNCDILGLSVLTPSVEVVYEISQTVRKLLPDIKIVMGNLHASLFSDEMLSENYADYIVHREGEVTMMELLKAIEKKGGFEQVKGISYLKDGAIINSPLRPFIEDLDSLPFPAWDLFPMEKYSTDPRTAVKTGKSEMQILGTRGCPNQCTFCSSKTEKHQGTRYRMRSPARIVDEIVYMNERYGAEVFGFSDLAFPLVKSHAEEFCNELIRRKVNKKIRWMSECRVKPLDTELLALMKRSGCVRVCFGIESGNNTILHSIKKNFTTADVRRAVDTARKAGLEVDGMFMIGLPGETEDMIKETIAFAIDIKVRYAIFNIFVPYPGCELWDFLTKEGKIKFDSWADFISYPTFGGGNPVYVPDGMTHKKLMELQAYAMHRFYLRPAFIYDELKRFSPSHAKKYYHGLKGLLSRRKTV